MIWRSVPSSYGRNFIKPEWGIDRVCNKCSGHIRQISTDSHSSKHLSQLVCGNQLRVELKQEHVTGQSGNYQISLKGYMYVYGLLFFKEHHLWNERSEQSVRELANPTQKSRYEHQWHWRAVKIYQRHNNPLRLILSANIVDIVIKNHRHHKLSYCHHLNANATRPMMVEVKPKRQRG